MRALAIASAAFVVVLASALAAAREPAPSARGVASASASPGFAPDPVPSIDARQWLVELRWSAGTTTLATARRVVLPKPVATTRNMGRFAVELYVGRTLLERVRFDFPLLGSDPEPTGDKRRWDSPPSFERGLSTRQRLWVPDLPRATRAVLVDRATGAVQELPWPFDATPLDAGPGDAEAADAGSVDGG